ncbi:carboxymuconolactone decarboxylase family protein [Lacisediminihabitans changchengi]|uniref:Carboxymuconolactone decarboxylase family protein n=1 Tax=Lacisediminihabitans changchengi TaxID=2787634 RepID=A0A934SNJ9_9MICO|nr:carboxymuconolactone decarboxylase family protein [Lacisediminihabitans changchengi]MBK4348823.1 carboxymuconolactone decarboxylase family protein [Lacisediminihabitans changchengi]
MSTDVTQESALFVEGLEVRRQVLGSAYVDAALAPSDPMTAAFQPFMTSYCWGEIWTDDTLSLREHSLLVLAMTAALGRISEVEIHTRGALRNGISPDELTAVLKQITVYCGVPIGVSVLKAMRGVIESFDPSEA